MPARRKLAENDATAPPQPKAKKARAMTLLNVHGSTKPSAETAADVDPKEARTQLNDHVKTMASTVDADWHDSYEETSEMLNEWLEGCSGWVDAVLRVGVKGGTAFGRCHEVLKIVADTWSNICAIPFRGDPQEDLDAGEGVLLEEFDPEEEEPRSRAAGSTDSDADSDSPGMFHSAAELLDVAWPKLLRRAAADGKVPEAALLQMIKDAHDHGVKDFKVSAASSAGADVGQDRLSKLLARSAEWQALPTTKKVHRMRRCIDRRFDGPKHLRTRDYDSGSDCDHDGFFGLGRLFGLSGVGF